MGFFKNILLDAEHCGMIGMTSKEAYEFLKEKYAHVDFSGEDFNLNGLVFDSYLGGLGEFDKWCNFNLDK